MSLLYRAIWQEDREQLIDVAAASAISWLGSKGIDLDSLPDGEVTATHVDPRFGNSVKHTLWIRRSSAGGVDGVRVRLEEYQTEAGQQWTTTLTALARSERGGTFWVDVDRISEDPFARVPFKAPGLVKTLIREGNDPRVGQVRLEPGPRVIAVGGLAGLIRSEERRLPIVVFAHDREGSAVTMARADAAYKQLAGVAAIFVLPPEGVEEFKARMGEDLAVWGGGARLYLPNRGTGGLRPERHRYVSGAQAAQWPGAAGEVISTMLSGFVPATPAPPDFDPVRRQLTGRADRDLHELLELAESENDGLRDAIQELREQLANRDDEIIDSIADNEELVEQNNRLAAEVTRLLSDRPAGETPGPEEPPDSVATIHEAIDRAGILSGVAIHPDAPVDIDKLERAVNSTAWAGSIWHALRALDAYSKEGGGFYTWCKNTMSPWRWHATDKKLAMKESEQVMANERLRAARMLPVDVAVSPSGFVEMQAHIKIAQGGGPLAPRIYFFDDVAGRTGKVHVGFIGPHEHMPNKSTN